MYKPLSALLRDLERTDPEVGSAKEALDRTTDRILGRGPALSFAEIAAIYGDQDEHSSPEEGTQEAGGTEAS